MGGVQDARRTHRGGNHACPELPGSASVTSDPRSQLPCCREDGGAHTAQRRVCVTGAGVGRLIEHAFQAVDSPGVGNHCESRLLESWLPGAGEEGSRSKVPSIAVVPGAAADFSTARWLVLLQVMMLTSARFSVAKPQEWMAEASPRCSPGLEVMPSLFPSIIDDLFHLEV